MYFHDHILYVLATTTTGTTAKPSDETTPTPEAGTTAESSDGTTMAAESSVGTTAEP